MDRHEFKAGRLKLGLSQTRLADKLDMGIYGQRTLRRWEIGERPINSDKASLLNKLIENTKETPNDGQV